MMHFLVSTAHKDLLRHLRDPLALALWIGIPLLLGGLISLVMGNMDKAPPTAHLLLADEDGGLLSELAVRAFGQGGSGQFLRVEKVERDVGQARLDRGEATALLIIPAGFGEAVLNDNPTTLLLVTNPAQQIMPRILEEGLGIAVDGAFYAQRIAGAELREIAQGPPQGRKAFSNQEIAQISVAINKIITRVEKYLFPPVIKVETKLDEQPIKQKFNVAQLFLPGILLMTLLFMAEGIAGDVWRERDQGTLRRLACTPPNIGVILGGKLLAGAVLMLGCALIVLLAGMVHMGTPLGKLPLVLAWAGLSGAVFYLLLLLIQLFASSQRAGTVLSNSILMPLLFVGGSFFPFEVMPPWMADIGRWTPNGWALAHLKVMLFGEPNAAAIAGATMALAAAGIVLFTVCAWRLPAFAKT